MLERVPQVHSADLALLGELEVEQTFPVYFAAGLDSLRGSLDEVALLIAGAGLHVAAAWRIVVPGGSWS